MPCLRMLHISATPSSRQVSAPGRPESRLSVTQGTPNLQWSLVIDGIAVEPFSLPPASVVYCEMKTCSVVLAICTATSVTWVSVDTKTVLCEDETRLQVANDSYDLPGKVYGAVDNDVTQSRVPESNFTIADEDVTQDDHLVSNSTAGKYVPVLRCSDSKDEQDESTESAWTFRTLPTTSSSPPFSMVTRLGVRVQGDKPEWNAKHQRFVSSYYETFDEKYRAVLDTVNMASVEGALKYVQAECINASVVDSCKRKNDIKYVVFYQTNVVQPSAAMEYYVKAIDEHKFAIESCPFVPLDGGRCNPSADGSFPKECNQYIGAAGEPKLGFCVGGTLQDNEDIAPYPHNYWFSFPNSCPLKLWNHKTDFCRKEFAGGLCPHGGEPDGETCTFSYEILGYILLDDVVGITSMVNPNTGDKYADYHEFCEAGGIEFSASLSTSLAGGHSRSVVDMTEGLEFWANPGKRDANGARVEKLVSAYNGLVSKKAKMSDGGVMRPLPTVSELRAQNPPCFENSLVCAKSKFGCKRSYRSQICQRCTSDDSDCEQSGDRAP